MIRLTVPSIGEEDLLAVREVLESGHLVQGARVAQFEREVAAIAGTDHAVAVANCTCALHLALVSLEVRHNDYCILPAYSWISTANVIEHCGAIPVFVDIDPRNFNIDLNKLSETLERLMTRADDAKRVKAVIPVHAFGQMADMLSLNAICERWELPVVEDAACALGAALHSKPAGSWGRLACFSFHPRKAVTTGEGGIIATNDDQLAARLRVLRNHGLDPDASPPDFVVAGYNYRMTEFQAALGSTQLGKLQRIVNARKLAAREYDRMWSGTGFLSPEVTPGAHHVYQSYVALLPKSMDGRRKDMIAAAKSAGVETQVGTIHMPLTTYYSAKYGHKSGDFPGADAVASAALTLPLYEGITQGDQRQVVDVLTRLAS